MLNEKKSHDLLGSLITIKSFAHLIKDDLSNNRTDNLDLYSELIIKSAEELSDLLEDMAKRS